MIKLHESLTSEIGKRTIEKIEIPSIITSNLNPKFDIRPYQKKAFQYFLTYWNEEFTGKPANNHHLLFHMATGSGKTLMMAGLMLYLYEQGYRNFLFFVNSATIIEKTRQNFLEKLASKYLFAQNPKDKDLPLTIRTVDNFQSVSKKELNICFSTIQGLHSNLNSARENGITYDDFEDKKIVLISDEAHHLNASTKKGQKLTQTNCLKA
jgi:type III restriction enzyme